MDALAAGLPSAVAYSLLAGPHSTELQSIHPPATHTFAIMVVPTIQHWPEGSSTPHLLLLADVSPVMLLAIMQPLLQLRKILPQILAIKGVISLLAAIVRIDCLLLSI